LENTMTLYAPSPASAPLHAQFLFTDAAGQWLKTLPVSNPAREHSAQAVVRRLGSITLVHEAHAGLRETWVYAEQAGVQHLLSLQQTPVQESISTSLATEPPTTYAAWQGVDPAGQEHAVLTQLNAQYVQAYRDANASWYDAHLAPDYLVTQGSGAFHDRATAIARFALSDYATTMRNFPVDRVNIRRVADIALIDAENAYTLKDGQQGISRYTDIWQLRDARWLCICAHITAGV
jgi:Domain of unknown function (DUF4440)